MSKEVVSALFDKWERVWHGQEYHLVLECIADPYIRHEESGTRGVTPTEYIAELATRRKARPNIRVAVYDHEFTSDSAWYRFTFTWTDPDTGEPRTQAGMQQYRIEQGKLAETWVTLHKVGSSWPDATAQETWTRKRK